MTTTPTIWQRNINTNFASLAGQQIGPQSIGLANGNILVLWQDSTGGPSPGIDIIGQLFDPNGRSIGTTPFQVNAAYVNAGETEPQVAALPDGGYVVAYGSFDGTVGGFIAVERFNSAGASVVSRRITDTNNSLENWELTVDSNGNYIVAFERDVGASKDVRAVVYDFTSNNPLPEYSAAQNSGDDDELVAVATFTNGNMITVSREPDEDTLGFEAQTVEYKIIEIATGNVIVPPVHVAGDFGGYTQGEDVAVLAGGQFVIVYWWTEFESDNRGYAMRIGAGGAPGSPLGPQINVVATPTSTHATNGAQVVALEDGGFIVVWADAVDGLFGTRYAANGTVIGDAGFQLTGGGAELGNLSLTSDGRVLVPYRANEVELFEVIIDGRESVIHGTGLGEVLTTQSFATDIFGEGGDDTIYGQAGNDFIYGGAGKDDLRGGGGADTLSGEAGIDELRGGTGDDSYILDDANEGLFGDVKFYDPVIENAFQGIDTVFVKPLDVQQIDADSYTLGDYIENGHITGAYSNFLLRGNGLDNRLFGAQGNDILDGLGGKDTLDGKGGADTMNGGADNDTYYVDNTLDKVVEATNQGTDTVVASTSYVLSGAASVETLQTVSSATNTAINFVGNGFINKLFGNTASNSLNGAGGADTMRAFAGNDYYIVDDAGDIIVEVAGEGTDTVMAGASYSLAAGVSAETLKTTSAIATTVLSLSGNELVNTLEGNAGDNVINGGGGVDIMRGFAGNDAYVVDSTADTVVEAADQGTDNVNASVSYVLGSNVSAETLRTIDATATTTINLTGNEFANILTGNAGHNLLNGGGGGDTLQGAAGNDAYIVDSAADTVDEAADQGSDNVNASVSYVLGTNVSAETLRTIAATATTAINLIGNNLINIVTGNAGSNTINGAAGNDTLTGNAGNDFFVFSTALNAAANVDIITDFSVPNDTIQLKNMVFTGLATGTLAAGAFHVGAAAADADDRIVYNNATGALIFDSNGNAADGATQFAKITAGLALTSADFVVI